MRRYFRLVNDMTIVGRRDFDDIVDEQGDYPFLAAGERADERLRLSTVVSDPGTPLPFSMTSTNIPVVTPALADAVAAVAGSDVQCLPVDIAGERAVVLNAVRRVRCLDENRSEFSRWTAEHGRPDKIGSYRGVTRLVLDRRALGERDHFFRVEGWRIALIVSDAVKAAMERAGCRGAQFLDVNGDDTKQPS